MTLSTPNGKISLSGAARGAFAVRPKGEVNAVAGMHASHACANALNNSGALMAEYGGAGRHLRITATDVDMAHPDRGDPHQHLVRAGVIEPESAEFEVFVCTSRERCPNLDRSFVHQSSTSSLARSTAGPKWHYGVLAFWRIAGLGRKIVVHCDREDFVNAVTPPFDYLSAEVLAQPFEAYQHALANHPVYTVPGSGLTIVTSYGLVAEATSRIDDFSNDFSAILAGTRSSDPDVTTILEQGWPQCNTLLTADPPDHTRFRRLVNLAFSMKRVDALEAHMRSIATKLIDGFIDDRQCEFVNQFAMPLPVQMIAEQIGIDHTDFATVRRWSDAFADRLGA